MVKGNSERVLATLVNDDIKSMPFCDDVGSLLNFLHIFLDEFSMLLSKFCLDFLSRVFAIPETFAKSVLVFVFALRHSVYLC